MNANSRFAELDSPDYVDINIEDVEGGDGMRTYLKFVPTMTGGYCKDKISRFYAKYFNPGTLTHLE
ncbi:hypothetical protein GX48_06618 [Paracoccidioides brasiliensis]|nr:hypothetical protein GX48_06618 [Paracoccidioides brasiliensis]